MRFCTRVGAAAATIVMVAAPGLAAFESALLVPLEAGSFRTLCKNGTGESCLGGKLRTGTVLESAERVNGVETTVIEFVEEATRTLVFHTNDELGMRTHGSFVPEEIDGDLRLINVDITFVPPLLRLESSFDVGESFESRATARRDYEAIEVISTGERFIAPCDVPEINCDLTLEVTTDVVGVETVTVPFGTFEALRMEETTNVFGCLLFLPPDDPDNICLSRSTAETFWLVEGIGTVKSVSTTDGVTDVSELIRANRLPEPTATLQQVLAFLALALIGRRSRNGK